MNDSDDELYVPPAKSVRFEKTHDKKYNLRPRRSKQKESKYVEPHPFPVSDWDSLFKLAELSTFNKFIDCEGLPSLLPAMININEMVGLKGIKDQLANNLLHFLQKKKFRKVKRLNHMIIYGPPGCGKTTLSHNIAFLLYCMGKIQESRIIVGNRQNMIGSYLGHTAKQTQDVINKAMGGVLLIDEAYSLGCGSDDKDSFAKTCIDTLNQNLTENGDKFVCIIVGYKESLQRNFFALNPGLKRRFPWVYTINGYTYLELLQIFKKMIKQQGLKLCKSEKHERFFKCHHKKFIHHAASVKEFVDRVHLICCKSSFGKRVMTYITINMMTKAIKLLHGSTQKVEYNHMYI